MSHPRAELKGEKTDSTAVSLAAIETRESPEPEVRRPKRSKTAPVDLISNVNPQFSPILPAAGARFVHSDTATATERVLYTAFRQALRTSRRLWMWIQSQRQTQLASKRLCLCETISLGEKRFLAVVKADGRSFLIAGTATTVSMLAHLPGHNEFGETLQRAQLRERLPI